MTSLFESQLLALGYPLEEQPDACRCRLPSPAVLFYQESKGDYCPPEVRAAEGDHEREVELTWYKMPLCPVCLEVKLGILDCGGYYHNLRIFRDDKEVTEDYEMRSKPLEPGKNIWVNDDHDYYADQGLLED